METFKSVAENFRVTLINALSPYFSMDQIVVIACIGLAIILILCVILSILIVVKGSKFLKKKWLITFGLADILSSLAISTLIFVIVAIIIDGFSTSMIVALGIFGILGFWGISYQIDKKDSYKEAGYTGASLIFRVVLNFICGILAVPFIHILIPMWVLSNISGIFNFIVDSSGDSDGKSRVQYSNYVNEKGEMKTVTTHNVSEHLSVTYYKDESGKDHTIYTRKR